MCRQCLDPGLKEEKLSMATGRVYVTENLQEEAKWSTPSWLTVGFLWGTRNYQLRNTWCVLSVVYYYELRNFPFTWVHKRFLPQCPVLQTHETAQTAEEHSLCSQKSQVQILTDLPTASFLITVKDLTCCSIWKMGIVTLPTSEGARRLNLSSV